MKEGKDLHVGGKKHANYTDYYQKVILPYMGKQQHRKKLNEIDESVVAEPVVNNGRWLVKCPFCSGAEPYFPDGKFMCLSCFNEGRGFVNVNHPESRKSIERELEKRPTKNQNWDGETIKKLKDENSKNLKKKAGV